jgi:DNA-binding CsgD family transcriptional regulator
MFAAKAWQAIAHSLDLSRRQMEILMAVFDDEKELVIAERLEISQHTVHSHMERMYQKLGVHSRLDLVRLTMAQFLTLTADITTGVPPICGYWVSQECPMRNRFGVDVR